MIDFYSVIFVARCLIHPTYFCFRSYAALTAQPNALNTSAVGYSGVLFTYALIEAFHSAEVSRSVFGLFSVPTKAYPFILLVLIQVGDQALPYQRISTWCLVFTEYLVFSPGADAEHLVVGAPIGAAGGGSAHLPPGRGCPRAHCRYCMSSCLFCGVQSLTFIFCAFTD